MCPCGWLFLLLATPAIGRDDEENAQNAPWHSLTEAAAVLTPVAPSGELDDADGQGFGE